MGYGMHVPGHLGFICTDLSESVSFTYVAGMISCDYTGLWSALFFS